MIFNDAYPIRLNSEDEDVLAQYTDRVSECREKTKPKIDSYTPTFTRGIDMKRIQRSDSEFMSPYPHTERASNVNNSILGLSALSNSRSNRDLTPRKKKKLSSKGKKQSMNLNKTHLMKLLEIVGNHAKRNLYLKDELEDGGVYYMVKKFATNKR